MHDLSFRAALGGALLGAAMTAPAPALAQYIGAAPPPPPPPAAGQVETPAAALARNIRLLALSPRSFEALMAAGRAELELGEVQAAAGFFGRADEVRPNDPAPKIGMGAAALQSGDTRDALSWFARAQALGASAAVLGADRGLAHDLLGELTAAQADYRSALSGPQANEARRRLALSLAMSGKMTEGLRELDPLLQRHDPGAQRVRAFVLALGGEQALAASAIDRAMPGTGSRMAPFLRQLPRLTVVQKAAAVHLGVFPTTAQLASATPVTVLQVAEAAPVRVKPAKSEVRRAVRPAPRRVVIEQGTVGGRTSLFADRFREIRSNPASGERDSAAEPSAVPAKQPEPVPIETSIKPTPEPLAPLTDTATVQQPVVTVQTADRLKDIDTLLAAPEAAPARLVEAAPVATQPKRAATKPGAKKADAKAAAAAEAREEAAQIGIAGSHWVQLAGGSNQDRMAAEYKRIKAKKPSLFTSRGGYVTAGKDYFRLLVGPFPTTAKAHDFVNALAKAGIDGFSWTRTPAQIKIEKLPAT